MINRKTKRNRTQRDKLHDLRTITYSADAPSVSSKSTNTGISIGTRFCVIFVPLMMLLSAYCSNSGCIAWWIYNSDGSIWSKCNFLMSFILNTEPNIITKILSYSIVYCFLFFNVSSADAWVDIFTLSEKNAKRFISYWVKCYIFYLVVIWSVDFICGEVSGLLDFLNYMILIAPGITLWYFMGGMLFYALIAIISNNHGKKTDSNSPEVTADIISKLDNRSMPCEKVDCREDVLKLMDDGFSDHYILKSAGLGVTENMVKACRTEWVISNYDSIIISSEWCFTDESWHKKDKE